MYVQFFFQYFQNEMDEIKVHLQVSSKPGYLSTYIFSEIGININLYIHLFYDRITTLVCCVSMELI